MAIDTTTDSKTDKVVTAQLDEHVTDPESPDAVQIPDGPNDGSTEDPLAVHRQPTPLEVFEGEEPDEDDDGVSSDDDE